jgi:hypothetical protein
MKQLAICFLSLFTFLQVYSQYDFRKTTWGMTKDEVIAAETTDVTPQLDDNTISYKGTVNSLDCNIVYVFIHDTLVRAYYDITEVRTNKNQYIRDYEGLKKILTDKYSQPDKDRVTWLNDMYQDNVNDWGQALSIGHLAYFSEWLTETTDIWLMLQGDNYKIKFVVEYTSLKYASLLKEVEAEEEKFDEL